MKKVAALVLGAFLTMLCCPAFAGQYTPGTYEASVNGMGGPVTVKMEFSEEEILSVEASGDQETKGLGDVAIEELKERILAAQSAEVDVVSGASVSSTAMLSAAADCIEQARGMKEEEELPNEEWADVVVVGAGAAGFSAAAGALEQGASVIILEANSFVGGAASTSMGNILDLDPARQAEQERNDASLEKYASYSEEEFPEPWKSDYVRLMEQISEYLENGEEKGRLVTVERVMVDHYLKGRGTDLDGKEVSMDYDLIRAGVEHAVDNYKWLESLGLTTTPLMEYVSTPEGRGAGLIELLSKGAEGAEVRLNTRAKKLLFEDGRITGVVADNEEGKEFTYHAAKGLILATGSFSSNGEMVAQYQRIGTGLTENIPSNNPAGNRGDGILMAQEVGAQLRDMSFIQTYLKGYQNLSSSGEASSAFGAAMLVVNSGAERFADESNQSRIVSREGNDQKDGVLFAIGDAKMIAALEEKTPGLSEDLISRGMAYQADTLEDLAQLAALDGETLLSTIDAFNGFVDAGEDQDFGRTAFNGKVEEGPFYAAKLQLACHLTFGGLVIDTQGRVLEDRKSVV